MAQLGHVHGLGVDPADNRLYVATHHGVFTVDEGEATQVAGRTQDTMGFTVVGPGSFLASGHPAPGDTSQPAHLGLIRSQDAAQTWEEVSLAGLADFHALDMGAEIVGYDGLSASILASEDGKDWRTLWEGQALDVAAHPEVTAVLATTLTGRVIRIGPAGLTDELARAPRLAFLDQPRPDQVVGLDARGQVWFAEDVRRSWARAGRPPGVPQAIAGAPNIWYVATDEGIFESSDAGASWQALL